MLRPTVAPVQHSAVVRRFRSVAAAVALPLALASAVGGCGSVRTELPATVVPPPPLDADPIDSTVETEAAVTEPEAPVTTASPFKSPGEKHPIPGGTLAPSYPRVGVRPPRGVAPPPAGQLWAVVNARFCAADDTPIAGHYL